ncbi:MAG: nucleoside deaminase [Phycisphaerae bacterium]
MSESTSTSDQTAMHVNLMHAAVDICRHGIAAGQSPFGAVIADRSGNIVVAEHNRVRETTDATAHAEVTAIRAACTKLGTSNLTGHIIASTCEPCPMCAAAIHWARLDGVVYGASIEDAQQAEFNELALATEKVYTDGGSSVKIFPRVLRDECCGLFNEWKHGPNPNPY